MKFNTLIPEFTVSDLDKSRQFYVDVLGFKIEYFRDNFMFLSFHGSQLMISTSTTWNTSDLKHPFGRGINFQLAVPNVQTLLDSLYKQKYPLFRELKDDWYRKDNELLGNREFLVQDPDGYLLRFFQDLGSKPAK